MAHKKIFDCVVFGATGYTGHYVVEEIAQAFIKRKGNWAIAGRNKAKLEKTLETVQQYLSVNISDIPIILADVNDPNSINEMCEKAKVILNCVGPYKYYGKVVVEACIRNKTHHVDLSGEIQYLELTQAQYFYEAKENGVYIVQCCGFDSIPADLGVALLKQNFPGDLNSVTTYLEFFQGPEGRVTNIGTWLSAVYSAVDVLFSWMYMIQLKKVFTRSTPKSPYPLSWSYPISTYKDKDAKKHWCIWFMGPDERVVMRSQMFGYEFLKERPVEVKTFMNVGSFFAALCYLFYFSIFGFLSLFPPGRYLLAKFPSFFSFGFFTHEGPTRKQVEESSMRLTLCGEGWSEKLVEPSDVHVEKPNLRQYLTVIGPDPAYVLTSTCLVHSALVILDETDKLPLTGGVLTPGVAFANTSLRERLEKRGIVFKFESSYRVQK